MFNRARSALRQVIATRSPLVTLVVGLAALALVVARPDIGPMLVANQAPARPTEMSSIPAHPSPTLQPPPATTPASQPTTPVPTPTLPPRLQSDHHFGIAEAFRNLPAALQAGVSWERLVFSWQYIQPHGPASWNAHHYFPDAELHRLRSAGVEVVGLLQDTPTWARQKPARGATSPPVGLYEPWDSPRNTWARFVERMAREYRGQIDHWIVWNEPEFQPRDQGGIYLTWSGGTRDYYQLLKVAYQAAKAANPDASVVFAATSYWTDVANGREQFLKRVLEIAATDPDAWANRFFFDAVAFNIYWSPDDIWRIAEEMRSILARHRLEKPLWITETNAMPYDDPMTPKPQNGQRVTLRDQAAFVIQAYAMAIAAGYERIGWHAMIDRDTSDEIWGLSRNNGSLRPAYTAYRLAAQYFSHADRVTFKPLERQRWRWQPGGYYPNWQVYLVAFDRGLRRVNVLWNAEGESLTVRLPKRGTRAVLVDLKGREQRLEPVDGAWIVKLPPASARGPADPPGYYFLGGEPRLLIEQPVPAGSPVVPPRLSEPATSARSS